MTVIGPPLSICRLDRAITKWRKVANDSGMLKEHANCVTDGFTGEGIRIEVTCNDKISIAGKPTRHPGIVSYIPGPIGRQVVSPEADLVMIASPISILRPVEYRGCWMAR